MRNHRSVWALAALLLVSGLGGAPAGAQTAYDEAVRRSAVYDSANVHELVAIPATETTVKVLTWTSRATADRFYPVGQGTVGVDVWVTHVPELKQLCASFPADADALRLRLQQALGLPAKVEDRVFVEMEVARTDLFRPCPDPDPAKISCGADFPAGASNDYKAWIATQVLSRYRQPDGYPWTRLGYTYDWGGQTIFGPSEFVIRKGAAVTVTAKSETTAYCH